MPVRAVPPVARTPRPDAGAERAGGATIPNPDSRPRPEPGTDCIRSAAGSGKEDPATAVWAARRALGDQRLGERRDDPVLRVEQTDDRFVDPGALAHLARRHVDEPRGDAQPIADTLIATGHEPPRTRPAAGGQGLVVPVSAIARVACPRVIADHAHAQAAQVARHRLGNSVADPRIGGLPAQVGEGHDQNRIDGLRNGRRRKPETEPPKRQDRNQPKGTLTHRASATRLHPEAPAGGQGKSRSLRRRTQRSEFCGAGSWSRGDWPKRRAGEAFRAPAGRENGHVGAQPAGALRQQSPVACQNAPRRTQRSATVPDEHSTETSTKSRVPPAVVSARLGATAARMERHACMPRRPASHPMVPIALTARAGVRGLRRAGFRVARIPGEQRSRQRPGNRS